MQYYHILSILLGMAVVVLLCLKRRRWMSFTCVGLFTAFYLLMNYSGVLLSAWGYEWQTIDRMGDLVPHMSPGQITVAVLIVNLGLFSVWAGIGCFEGFFGRPPIQPNLTVMDIRPDSPLGMDRQAFWLMGLIATLAFLYTFNPIAGSFFSVVGRGSVSDQLEYRLDVTRDRTHYLVTLLGYCVIPYLALCGIAFFLKTRRRIYLLLLPLALLGKFVYLHKEPLVVFSLQIGVFYVIWRASRPDTSLRMRGFPWIKVAVIGVAAFSMLPLLYMVVLGYGFERVTWEDFNHLALASVERILGRMSNSYFYFAYFIPDRYPHHGFGFVKTMSDFLGMEYVAINKEIFFDMTRFKDLEDGSIASDNIVNLYGGFGYVGVIVGGFLQGLMLSATDRWFARCVPTLGRFVLYTFLVILFGITLNQAHVFGVLLGYGGILFVVMAWLINSNTESVKCRAAYGPSAADAFLNEVASENDQPFARRPLESVS